MGRLIRPMGFLLVATSKLLFHSQFSHLLLKLRNQRRHRRIWSAIGSCKFVFFSIKQVTKSNFPEALIRIKFHISSSDFISISLKKSGSFSSPWHRVQPFDTAETAYSKVTYSAERFQVFQFAICPFRIDSNKLVAHPYNFHLFPRDELRAGRPSYIFSCQTSHLTSMAQEGFDFNLCVYDGISYLSREQELAVKDGVGKAVSSSHSINSPRHTVADIIFIERIKSRIKNWRSACTDSSESTDALLTSLKKLAIGCGEYGSRPCINVDVCSERQVQLIVEAVSKAYDDLVVLKIPAKGTNTQAVRIVLTSSTEDKTLLEKELRDLEDEQSKKIRGFREVIDLISASQKPIITFNFLNDLTFVHSKFLAPLPANVNDFIDALRLAFPSVVNVNHLLKEVGPLKKATNLHAAMSILKKRFLAPIDMDISHQDEGKTQGSDALKISLLFVKLCSILKISPDNLQSSNHSPGSVFGGYANSFTPCSAHPDEEIDENKNIRMWTNNTKKVRCEDLVFVWGFRNGISGKVLKDMLQGSHDIFSKDFDVRLVDKSCAIVVFWQSGLSSIFLETMDKEEITGSLRELVSEGLRATGYGTYRYVCKSGLWDAKLADALDKALIDAQTISGLDSDSKASEIYWDTDYIINLDEL